MNRPSLREAPSRSERRDDPEISELAQPVLTAPERAEEEALDLVGGEDLVLEKADEHVMVSLVERARARARLVSLTSNHISGTVLRLLWWVLFGVLAP